MPAKPRQGLSDLRPADGQIQCFYCNQRKPAGGAVRFRAHVVCSDCTATLKTTQPKG